MNDQPDISDGDEYYLEQSESELNDNDEVDNRVAKQSLQGGEPPKKVNDMPQY